jgi:hypothetical protein
VSPLPFVDARTLTPPEEQASALCLPTATTSTSATSASRGYRLLGAHTGLCSNRNIRTLTTLRLRGGGGCQPVGHYLWLLLQSHRVWCPRCDCGGLLDSVCVSGPAPLLGCRLIRVRVVSLYIVPHILSIHQALTLSYTFCAYMCSVHLFLLSSRVHLYAGRLAFLV